jgi:hypothetical protein
MAGLLDYLEGIGETGATLGTGLLSGAVGAPYGLFKGITSGYYGSPKANRIAEEEAKKFMERNTYVPRGKVAQEALQKAAQLMEQSKLPPIIPEAIALGSIPRQAYLAQAERRGMDLERAMAPRVERMLERGGAGADILQGLAQGSRSNILPQAGRSGFGAFDPRYDPRVLEQARMQAMTRDVQLNPNAKNAPSISLTSLAGMPFITSMADRTAAGGNLLGIDNVQFNRPVGLLGGQDFMFNNPGLVWSSGNAPANALMKYAAEVKSATGQNPIYLPYRMAPTGGDFAQMTGETMLAYADAAMGSRQKNRLDKSIKKFIPDWSGVSDPASVQQFRAAPDKKRKAIKAMMDRDFRNEGGINIGGARLAVSDPMQLAAQEGGLQNVGEIFAGRPLIQSTHPAYPGGVPGKGIGTLAEDINVFQLLPDVVKARGIPNPMNPRPSDLRAMQMKPYSGLITDELLKSLGY